MPIYEYKCIDCTALHEVLQKLSDNPISQCPVCSSSRYSKQISTGTAFSLKGNGYYVTDFKGK